MRIYLNIVMAKLLAENKLAWLVKLVGVYQLTCVFSMALITEVNRETVVMVDAFESTFTKT